MLKIGLALFWTLIATQAFAQAPTPTFPPRKIAVVTAVKFITAGLPKSIHERERFLATFTRRLNEKGWTTVEATTNCTSAADCLPEVGQQAHTSYVLRIAGEGNLEYGYNLQLELYSSSTARVQKALAYCDLCNADKVAGIAAPFALDLLATTTKEEQALQQPANQHTAHATLPTHNSQPPRDIVSKPVAPALHQTRAWIPWSMLGVGALGMVYGAYALHKNGECSETSRQPVFACDRISSRTLGVAALASGGILFIGGGIWKLASALSVSPDHVALNVRF